MTQLLNPSLIRSRTAELAKQFEPPVPADGRLSAAEKKAALIGAAIADGDFGCRRESVRQLVSAITGMEIILPDRDGEPGQKTHIIGSMIVFADHTLLVSRLDSDGDAFFVTKSLMSEIPYESVTSYISRRDEFRPATVEEIDTFLTALGVPLA